MSATAAERRAAVMREIAAAAQRAGRDPRAIRLLAVSKGHPAAALRALYELGQREFGENYAQEMAAKATDLADLNDLRFVFIGTVQSNKIPLIVRAAAEIQSVASERHARLIAKAVEAQRKQPFPVYILVNAGDEATKGGLTIGEAQALGATIARDLPQLVVQGLMAIPPPLAPLAVDVPELYRELSKGAARVGLGKLSLGMSQDLAVAIGAGSDCVRVGTALLGARPGR